MIDIDGHLSIYKDATHVSATEERPDIGGVGNVVIGFFSACRLKQEAGLHLHGTAFHVFVELCLIFQIHLAETNRSIIWSRLIGLQGTQHTLTSTGSICHIVSDHVRSVIAEEHAIDGYIRA